VELVEIARDMMLCIFQEERGRFEEGPWQLPLHAVQVVFQNNTTPDPPLSLSAGCFKLLKYLQLGRYRGKDRAAAGKAALKSVTSKAVSVLGHRVLIDGNCV
jgi:hypothetical protein